MKQSSPYERLPGLGREIASYTRLYLGPDHLLQVTSAGFSERYKRFYFRDIQAVVFLRTQTWIWILALCVIAGLLSILIASSVSNKVGASVLGVLAGLFIAFGIASAVRGPSCRCYVRTAVQTEKIASLNRKRRAEKTVARLQPLIEAAQSSIVPVAVANPSMPASPEATAAAADPTAPDEGHAAIESEPQSSPEPSRDNDLPTNS